MIREATEADLPHLRAIQASALVEPWTDLLAPAVAGPPLVLVAVPADASTDPVGYGVAIPDAETAYLAELAVTEPHRRAGHGTALLEALADRLAREGCDRLRLTVRVGDRGAREFYERLGFRAESLLPDRYDADDGLLLTRQL
jgi:ribosomal-protein-alanine N-acetyltransferase